MGMTLLLVSVHFLREPCLILRDKIRTLWVRHITHITKIPFGGLECLMMDGDQRGGERGIHTTPRGEVGVGVCSWVVREPRPHLMVLFLFQGEKR